MDTHLMIGLAIIVALIGIAASRDLLRALRLMPKAAPVRAHERADASHSRDRDQSSF